MEGGSKGAREGGVHGRVPLSLFPLFVLSVDGGVVEGKTEEGGWTPLLGLGLTEDTSGGGQLHS